jgi:uncharacterized membrane protein
MKSDTRPAPVLTSPRTATADDNDRMMEALIQQARNRVTLYPYTVAGILIVLYLVGIWGMESESFSSFFKAITPGFLMLNALVMLIFQPAWNWSQGLLWVGLMMGGYLVECLGVHSGFPFGNYGYGSVLGPKLWAVPPVIGVNWLLLTGISAEMSKHLLLPRWIQACFAGALMTFLDWMIEPVAIRLGFWDWFGQQPPIQNYLSWWVIGSIFAYSWLRLASPARNVLAPTLYALQLIFFLALA